MTYLKSQTQPPTARPQPSFPIPLPVWRFRPGFGRRLAGLVIFIWSSGLFAQDRTVLFNLSDPGVSKAIPTWGLDTAWLSTDNVRRGVIFMGQPQVDVIRFSFTGDRPL